MAVLAIPVIGIGSWAILKSMSGDSGSDLTSAEAEVAENGKAHNETDQPKRDWAEAANEQHERINSGKPFTPKGSSVRPPNNPGKITLNDPKQPNMKPRRNRVDEIELGSIRLTDNKRLHAELAELSNAIALNWIYMYPEGQLAAEGFTEIEHQKKVDEVYDLADKISDQRLRGVVREAAQQLDKFPNQYTEIRGDASLEGAIVSLVGQQIVKAQF
ncbi:hypothetical protein OAL44_00235 [Planctomycetaceae bacterium]|nr:hypothetical protein [Planctomycetaceae bacterium]